MTLAARHLQARRPRKDRDVTWSRSHRNGDTIVTWTFWRRDHRHALHSLSRHFAEWEDAACIRRTLQEAKRELRDFVDEIDLAAMEETTCSAP